MMQKGNALIVVLIFITVIVIFGAVGAGKHCRGTGEGGSGDGTPTSSNNIEAENYVIIIKDANYYSSDKKKSIDELIADIKQWQKTNDHMIEIQQDNGQNGAFHTLRKSLEQQGIPYIKTW